MKFNSEPTCEWFERYNNTDPGQCVIDQELHPYQDGRMKKASVVRSSCRIEETQHDGGDEKGEKGHRNTDKLLPPSAKEISQVTHHYLPSFSLASAGRLMVSYFRP